MIGADLLIMDNSKETLETALKMNIKLIGSPNASIVKKIENNLILVPRKLEYDIDTLKPSRKTLIAYKPTNRADARRAGKIGNIAILFDNDNIALCDEKQANIMRGKHNYIEIILRDLLIDDRSNKYIRNMIRCIRYAYRSGIPILLSSGAKNRWELWHPKTLVIIEKLFIGRRGILTLSWIEVFRKWNPSILSKLSS